MPFLHFLPTWKKCKNVVKSLPPSYKTRKFNLDTLFSVRVRLINQKSNNEHDLDASILSEEETVDNAMEHLPAG